MDINKLTLAEKLFSYVMTRFPLLDEKAIFSDETSFYKYPTESKKGESVKVRLRTKKNNIDKAKVCFNGSKIPMEYEFSDDLFDYYRAKIPKVKQQINYYFEIHIGRLSLCYNKRGLVREVDPHYNYKIIPDFKTPDWAKGAIMYQIYTDRFYNGDKTNDPESGEYKYIGKLSQKVDDWYQTPNVDGVREFYGGDLQGVIDKLDYIKDLGVEVIYFNPLFVSPSNHKYDIQDYDHIDPHFGRIINDEAGLLKDENDSNTNAKKYIKRTTDKENLEASNQLFIDLVEKAHSMGIRVILDGVFNHCGSFNKWLDREKIYESSHDYVEGAYSSQKSPYVNYFYFQDKNAWPDNYTYDGWWGHDTLPKLNYEETDELYNNILEIAKKWVSPPYNADGWRLDVAADLGYSSQINHKFWRDFRRVVKKANPNAIILAEHYGNPSAWLSNGDQWDTVMNYDAFMEPVSWFLTGLEKHSEEYREDLYGNIEAFKGAMDHHMARFHHQSLLVAMNQLSNHDHSRFLTRTNKKVGRLHTRGAKEAEKDINYGIMKEGIVIQMTWPGAPTIYYGDEAGLCGWTDPDNRRTYPWGRENKELIDLHKILARIRKENPILKYGSLKYLSHENFIISYARFDLDEKIIVIVNNYHEEKTLSLPVWEIGALDGTTFHQLLETAADMQSTSRVDYRVEKGYMEVTMPRYSTKILRLNNQNNEK